MFLFLQIDNSLNFLTQSIQSYTNIVTTIENFIISSRVNYTCIASSQNKFVLPDLSITMNFSNVRRYYISYIRVKKCSIAAFTKMNNF